MTAISPILTVKEAADWLQCSTRTVEDLARAGKLPGKVFGEGGWVFPAEAFFRAVNRMAEEEAERRSKPAPHIAVQKSTPEKQKARARNVPGLHLLPQAGGKILAPQ